MIVKHLGEPSDEHRIVFNMTTLEAHLWLKGNALVRNEAERLIRKALAQCDEWKAR